MKDRGKIVKLEELVRSLRGIFGVYLSWYISCYRDIFLFFFCKVLFRFMKRLGYRFFLDW